MHLDKYRFITEALKHYRTERCLCQKRKMKYLLCISMQRGAAVSLVGNSAHLRCRMVLYLGGFRFRIIPESEKREFQLDKCGIRYKAEYINARSK